MRWRLLLPPLGLLVLLSAALAIGVWQPWVSEERDRQLAWLEAFAAWSDRVDTALDDEDAATATACEKAYADDVGTPPSRLAAAGRVALAGCRRMRQALGAGNYETAYEWFGVRYDVLSDLTDQRTEAAKPRPSAELAAHAGPLSGTRPKVFCWADTQWVELSEEWRLVDVDDLWPIGFADRETDRIHLAPEICSPLERFFGGDYAPNLNQESLDLAAALVTLAHEAEHLRSPDASEAEVECVAIQRVRDLVREEGRSSAYEDLMTGLAWDVGYPDVPEEYRTESCHDGGPLDVRPETAVFP